VTFISFFWWSEQLKSRRNVSPYLDLLHLNCATAAGQQAGRGGEGDAAGISTTHRALATAAHIRSEGQVKPDTIPTTELPPPQQQPKPKPKQQQLPQKQQQLPQKQKQHRHGQQSQ